MKRHGNQAVMITGELFQFVATGRAIRASSGDAIAEHKLLIGTDKFPVGELRFKAHRPYEIPTTTTGSGHYGQWHVSFGYTQEGSSGTPEPMSEGKLVEYFSGLTAEELDTVTVGCDRGIIIPLATSDEGDFDFTDVKKKRPSNAGEARRKHQRRLARQQKGSRLSRRRSAAQTANRPTSAGTGRTRQPCTG